MTAPSRKPGVSLTLGQLLGECRQTAQIHRTEKRGHVLFVFRQGHDHDLHFEELLAFQIGPDGSHGDGLLAISTFHKDPAHTLEERILQILRQQLARTAAAHELDYALAGDAEAKILSAVDDIDHPYPRPVSY